MAHWRRLKQRITAALGEVRSLTFIVLDDDRACLRVRCLLGRAKERVIMRSFGLLSHVDIAATLPTLPECIQQLGQFVYDEHEQFLAVRALERRERQDRRQQAQQRGQEQLDVVREEHDRVREPTFDWAELLDVLSHLVVHSLLGSFQAFAPLSQRLSAETQQSMDALFGDQYRAVLQRGELLEIDAAALQPNSRFRSWASMVEWSNVRPIENARQDVRQRLNRTDWGVDPQTQQRKIDAYNTTVDTRLKASRVTRSQKSALEQEKSQLEDELKLLKSEDALLMWRTRQHRLKPTREQARQLKKTMDACRYTHNKCVEYRRKGGEGGKNKLQKLFVTRRTQRQVPLEYPEDMGPPPEWVLETPASVRKHAVSNFVSATSSAFTNLDRGHITHFTMHFKSRRDSNYFTIYADAQGTHLNSARHRKGTPHFGPAPLPRDRKPKKVDQYLTIPSVPNILIRADEGTEIEGEVRIEYAHGYWYAQLPHLVAPLPVEDKGRCTAGDPGLKGFLTTMDLQGNVAHLGRANWERLSALKTRQRAAQRRMSRFVANKKYRKRHHLGRHTGREWKQFVAARREFYTVSAKLENYVKDLHYKATSHLCHNTDVILLPKFSTSSMVRPSAPWTHAFNDQMNTLAHYQFRRRLLAKCEVAGKALVLCSEMYSSRTCGRCCRLHLTLRNEDVFRCPHCGFQAGRDENAAYNILRFVCAGSLSVYAVNGVQVVHV